MFSAMRIRSGNEGLLTADRANVHTQITPHDGLGTRRSDLDLLEYDDDP